MIKSVECIWSSTHDPHPHLHSAPNSLFITVTPLKKTRQSTAMSRCNVLVSSDEIRQSVKYWVITHHSPSPFVLCAVQSLSHFVRIHSGTPSPVMDDTFAFPLHSDVQSNAKMTQILFALTCYSPTLSAAASADNYYSELIHHIYLMRSVKCLLCESDSLHTLLHCALSKSMGHHYSAFHECTHKETV